MTVYIDLVEELPLLLYASDSTLSRVIGAMGSLEAADLARVDLSRLAGSAGVLRDLAQAIAEDLAPPAPEMAERRLEELVPGLAVASGSVDIGDVPQRLYNILGRHAALEYRDLAKLRLSDPALLWKGAGVQATRDLLSHAIEVGLQARLCQPPASSMRMASARVGSSSTANGWRSAPDAIPTPCAVCQFARTHLVGIAFGNGRAMHVLDAAHSVVATCCRQCEDGPSSPVDAQVVRRLLRDADDRIVVDDDDHRIYDSLSWLLFRSRRLREAVEGALCNLGGEACVEEIANTIRSSNGTWRAAKDGQVRSALCAHQRIERSRKGVFRLKSASSTPEGKPPIAPHESEPRIAKTADDIVFKGDG